MNIDLRFQDWSLVLAGANVRQYDDRAQTVRVTGCIPEGWHWKLYASVFSEAYFNSIPLTEADGALSAVLTRDDLAFGDTIYTLQLVGGKGDVTRHTNPVRLYVGASLSGDGVWPEIPRSFTDAEQTALSAAEAAVQAGGEAMARLDRLVTFDKSASENTVEVPDYTNVIPASIDTDGMPYQGGAGYLYGCRLKSSGDLETAVGAGVTGFIPLPENAAGMVLRFRGMRVASSGMSTASSIHFYNASFVRTHGGQTGQGVMVIAETDENGNVTRVNCADQTNAAFVPRAGDAYFRVSAYGMSADSVITINEEIRTKTVQAPSPDSVALRPEVHVPLAEHNAQRLTALETAVSAIPDPEDPLIRYADQIDRAQTIGYAPVLTNRPTAGLVEKKTLNFLHVSDTHGSVNLDRAVSVLNHLAANGRCACMVHTGDLHASTFASDYAPVQAALDAAQAPVLLVTGNHDAGNNQKTMDDTATDAQLYERMFAPVIERWDVTNHPVGKCYWYKDFADAGVRLIGLHDFESDYDVDPETGLLLYKRGFAAYHQEQIDWLIEALVTCPAGYGVIIAKHNPVNLRGGLDNPFNGEFLRGQNTGQTYVSRDIIPTIVQAFMDGNALYATFPQTQGVVTTLTVQQNFACKNAGAHFICYLNGHTHADGVSFLQDYPKQLELNIGCDNFHYQHYSDTLNQQNTHHQDLMNYVSVDVNRGYVYIQRIGNDFTAQADRRDFTAIDYKNPPTAEDVTALATRVSALEADNGGVWEKITELTFDGSTPFAAITGDSGGNPFRLRRAAVRLTLPNAAAAGSVTITFRYSGYSSFAYRAYLSWAANSASRTAFAKVWPEYGFWFGESLSFSNAGFGYTSEQTDLYFTRSVAVSPYIDTIGTSAAFTPPEGMKIELWGVRV